MGKNLYLSPVMPLTETLLLPDAWLGLWQIDETEAELMQHPEARPLLAELNRFANAQRRREFAASRLLVSAMLKEAGYPAEIPGKDASGKPFLARCPLSLSISHTGDLASVLLARSGSCGLDLEPVRPAIMRLAPKFLSEAELAHAHSDPLLATLYWSIKETVYKLYGRRKLQFNEHMQVQPFEPGAQGGTAFATLAADGPAVTYPVSYQIRNELVLTWCTAPQTKPALPPNE